MQNTESPMKSQVYNMPRKLLFIVNPNAGKRISDAIIRIIRKEFPQNMYYQIVIWKSKEHFEEISTLLKSEGYTDAIAVGGDGTVNKVASEIRGTNIRLGIVPIGSGNGLARSLGLSMDIEEVIKQIVEGRQESIDCGMINGDSFFCTSGVGFDAHIALLFAKSKTRGLWTYVKITIEQLLKYKAKQYTLEMNCCQCRTIWKRLLHRS
jgi:diacylglycerol kinase (ATP)